MKNRNPKFSIISPDLECHVNREMIQKRCIPSIAKQSCQDFEWIIVHDGPKSTRYESELDFSALKNKPIFANTESRTYDWGLSQRDHGMKNIAKGEFLINLNIDDMLRPNCLRKLLKTFRRIEEKIAIFSIVHHQRILNGKPIVMKGHPVQFHIDLLQLVAHRDIWKDIEYFSKDKTSQGFDLNTYDGITYERMCAKHKWVNIDEVLGEHF